jgi:hypothetical protein
VATISVYVGAQEPGLVSGFRLSGDVLVEGGTDRLAYITADIAWTASAVQANAAIETAATAAVVAAGFTVTKIVITGSAPLRAYSQATDPGAVGVGAVWIKHDAYDDTYEVYLRNDEDTAWRAASYYDVSGTESIEGRTTHRSVLWRAKQTEEPIREGSVFVSPSSVELSATEGAVAYQLKLTAFGLEIVTPGGNVTSVMNGSIDPSAGVGIYATLGSLYLRTNGQAWIKTGAADTAWTRLATV